MAAARERLSFDDAQILRLESEAIKGHTGKLLVLDPGEGGRRLEPEALRKRVGERIASLPRLRERVARPRLGIGRPAWVEDPALDLGWHVSEVDAAHPLDRGALRGLAGELFGRRLDHERPLWRLDVAPLGEGRTAVLARIHHALADGVSAIRLAAWLLWDASEEPKAQGPEGMSPGAVRPGAATPAPGRGCSRSPTCRGRESAPSCSDIR